MINFSRREFLVKSAMSAGILAFAGITTSCRTLNEGYKGPAQIRLAKRDEDCSVKGFGVDNFFPYVREANPTNAKVCRLRSSITVVPIVPG